MLERWRHILTPTTRGGLYYFGFFAAAAAYMPFISIYYADRGLSGQEIGFIGALGPLVALVIAPALAALADRRGWHKQMLTLGLAGSALALLVLPLTTTLLMLMAVVVAMGIIGSPVSAIADSRIAQMAVRHKLNYGKMRLWGSAAWIVVPGLGGALWQQVGTAWAFPLASLMFLLTIIAALLLDEREPVAPAATPASRSWRLVGGDVRFWTVVGCSFFLSTAMGMSRSFAGIYMDRLSGQALVGLFAAVSAASEVPVMLWSERIMERLGGPRALLLACAVLTSSYLLLTVADSAPLLLVVGVLQGLGFGLVAPITVRLVAGWAPPARAATYQGLLSAGTWGLAPLVAGPLGGSIFDASGPSAVFVTSTISAVIGGLVLIIAQALGVFRRPDEQQARIAET